MQLISHITNGCAGAVAPAGKIPPGLWSRQAVTPAVVSRITPSELVVADVATGATVHRRRRLAIAQPSPAAELRRLSASAIRNERREDTVWFVLALSALAVLTLSLWG